MADKYLFKFKCFDCRHGNSSMRIGVDAVLLGAWAGDGSARSILDVGTGCGVIALMMAQRNPLASIEAIDIDAASVAEATLNFRNSPWGRRLSAWQADFSKMPANNATYDLIVSNPPYFDSGVSMPSSRREVARHQSVLSPASIIRRGREMLTQCGRLAVVIPHDQADFIKECATAHGLYLSRQLDIKGNGHAPVKRSLLEFSNAQPSVPDPDHRMLILETEPGHPTPEHHALCRDFYLKW